MKNIDSVEFHKLCSIIKELSKTNDSHYINIIKESCKGVPRNKRKDTIALTKNLLEIGLQVDKLKVDENKKYIVCDPINVKKARYYPVICEAIKAIISNNNASTIANIAGHVSRNFKMKKIHAKYIVEPLLKTGAEQGLFVSLNGVYTLPEKQKSSSQKQITNIDVENV